MANKTCDKTYYYVVKKGIIPGIFRTWSECKEQIHEYPGAIYKKFDNMTEAVNFLHSSSTDNTKNDNTKNDNKINNIKQPYKKFTNDVKKTKTVFDYFDQYEKLDEKLDENDILDERNVDIEDYKDEVVDISVSRKDLVYDIRKRIYVFCDGSAIHNKNYKSIRCGYGLFILIPTENDCDCIFFGEELVSSGTNNLAELNAILHGLKYIKNEYFIDTNTDNNAIRNICFISDSKYSINCILVWSKSWIKNNWQTVHKKPVENKELIQEILTNLEEVKKLGFTVDFKHINSHQVKPENNETNQNNETNETNETNKSEPAKYLLWFGNEMADQLARTGKISKHHDLPKILKK
jgi:ribonuclease HI